MSRTVAGSAGYDPRRAVCVRGHKVASAVASRPQLLLQSNTERSMAWLYSGTPVELAAPTGQQVASTKEVGHRLQGRRQLHQPVRLLVRQQLLRAASPPAVTTRPGGTPAAAPSPRRITATTHFSCHPQTCVSLTVAECAIPPWHMPSAWRGDAVVLPVPATYAAGWSCDAGAPLRHTESAALLREADSGTDKRQRTSSFFRPSW